MGKQKYFTEEERNKAKKEKYIRYREKHPEKVKEAQKKYYQNHKGKINQWHKENSHRYIGSVKDDFKIDCIYSFKADDDFGFYKNEKYIKGNQAKNKYIHIWLKCTDGKYRNCLEHIIKWEYFNGKIPEGYEIDHIIPISEGGTNKLSNLRLVTHIGNMNNPITKKRHLSTHQGKPVIQLDLEGNIIKEWNSALECDGKGFSSRYVYDACNGKNGKSGHKYNGYNWYYKNEN